MSETEEEREYLLTMDNGEVYLLYGKSAIDIFSKIDGLRLLGKLWLEAFDRVPDPDQPNGRTASVFVNINHIVSISEHF